MYDVSPSIGRITNDFNASFKSVYDVSLNWSDYIKRHWISHSCMYDSSLNWLDYTRFQEVPHICMYDSDSLFEFQDYIKLGRVCHTVCMA